MLAHVIDTARALQPAGIHVVHGHGGDAVQAAFDDQPDLQWAEQAQQLGTGHAAATGDARRARRRAGAGAVWRRAADHARDAATPAGCAGRLAVLAAGTRRNPPGYGRIVRDAEGRVAAIVEQKDADEEQRRIGTVNTGVIAAEATPLKRWLQRAAQRQRAGRVLPHRRVRAGRRRVQRRRDRARRRSDGSRGRQRRVAAGAAGACIPAPRGARACACRACVSPIPARVDIRGTVRVGPRCRDRRRRDPRGRRRARRRRAHRSVLPARRTSSLAAGTQVRAHCDLDGARTRRRRARSVRSRDCVRAPCWPTACTSATSSRPRTRASASAARPTT